MTDNSIPVELKYYDVSTGWMDLTSYVTGFQVVESGVNRISSATVNFECLRSNLSSFLANPYRLFRIRINPAGTWQTLFLGSVNNASNKGVPGTTEDRVKANLDCLGPEARLSSDYMTFDYFKLQSALTPYSGAEAWTYRKVLQNMFDYPDSRFPSSGWNNPTGFQVVADTNPSGIDHIIDSSCSFDRETIFANIRTILDRIGYDGYYYMASESATPQLIVAPFDKASTYTFSAPYIGEPEYSSGSLDDIYNLVYVTGGVDVGVPTDGDRWTEYGYVKYTPKIWSATRTSATTTLTDEDNAAFANEAYRVGSKCIKVSTTGSTNATLTTSLDITQTEVQVVDASNRCSLFVVNVKLFADAGIGPARRLIIFILSDSYGHKIQFKTHSGFNGIGQAGGWLTSTETNFAIPIGDTNPIQTNLATFNAWVYNTGTSFDWEHIVVLQLVTTWESNTNSGVAWGHYIDGLQFSGGLKIDPFENPAWNPPAKDQTSINTHGIHVLHIQNSTISSFEQAQAEGTRVCSNLKNPIPTLTIQKYPSTTQLQPGNVVLCNSNYYRIATITYDWMNNDKVTKATYKLITKTSALPPIWTEEAIQKYLMK